MATVASRAAFPTAAAAASTAAKDAAAVTVATSEADPLRCMLANFLMEAVGGGAPKFEDDGAELRPSLGTGLPGFSPEDCIDITRRREAWMSFFVSSALVPAPPPPALPPLLLCSVLPWVTDRCCCSCCLWNSRS